MCTEILQHGLHRFFWICLTIKGRARFGHLDEMDHWFSLIWFDDVVYAQTLIFVKVATSKWVNIFSSGRGGQMLQMKRGVYVHAILWPLPTLSTEFRSRSKSLVQSFSWVTPSRVIRLVFHKLQVSVSKICQKSAKIFYFIFGAQGLNVPHTNL